MRKKILLFTLISFICLNISIFSSALNLPIQKIGNTEFYIYKVIPKETIYSISKKLNISKDDILKYNPSIIDGLKSEQTLFFPVSDFKPKEAKAPIEENVKSINHLVQRGETLYGISKLYDVSQDDLISLNPGIENGVKSGQVVLIPQKKSIVSSPQAPTNTTSNISKPSTIFYTIKKGDTLFNLAQRFSTSIDNILGLNPGLSPTNFKIDEVIKINSNTLISEEPVATPKRKVEFTSYKVEKDETFYSIAKKNNVTVEELQQANSNVATLKKGQIIYIPNIQKPTKSEETLAIENTQKEKAIYDSIHAKTNDGVVDVAIILPYMLNLQNPNKTAKLYTEFYRGFLLAVNDIQSQYGNKINIYAYDTENSNSRVDSILKIKAMKNMDLIIAPDEQAQLDKINKFGKENKINIVNTFIIKDDSYTDNANFFQVNIPHSYMFAEVIDEFNNRFKDREIVFLSDEKGGEEKDLIVELKKYLKDHPEIKVHNVNYTNSLKAEDIDGILEAGNDYIFIPTKGTKQMLSRINIALKRIKGNRPDIDMIVLGYPEWTMYMSEYSDTFKKMDTYIYTRFFANPDDDNLNGFKLKYKKWFGGSMIMAVPQFGLLGYDIGMYFIGSMCNNGNDFNSNLSTYNGLQNDFRFERPSKWSGFINKSLYFVHFSPYGSIEKISK